MTLPPAFVNLPLAHRGLHDRAAGRVENSRAAFVAAIDAGYGIELDVQMSRDGVPMVFHDDTLDRLTGRSGPVRDLDASELARITLTGSDDRIERLDTILEMIGDRVPVVVEIKDQSGLPSTGDHALDQITGQVLTKARAAHGCQVAIMSFNPAYIQALDWLSPEIPRGLTTTFADDFPDRLPQQTREALARIEGFAPGMSFVSHHQGDLDAPRIAALKAAGVAILCWTIKSPEEEAAARRVADNITFEGYAAPFPA